MNEPVSMFDLMIHNNRTEFQRKDDDQRYFFETTESWSTKRFKLMRKFLNEDPFLYDEFDWDVKPAKNDYYIAVPLLYKYRNVQFLFDQGLVEFSMRMSWGYDKRIERSDTFIKQKARLKLTQSNIAKLCEIQLIRVSFNKVEKFSHQGYSTGAMREIEDLQQKLLEDVIYSVKIHILTPTLKSAYLTCSTRKYGLHSDEKGRDVDDSGKIKYEYTGDWHELG